ncbi:MAG: hypothetical protein K2P68_08435 [Sphingomonas sp.]|nr:hypothetical protein [Sphingomonas sp.]
MRILAQLSAGLLVAAAIASGAMAQERIVTRERTVVTRQHRVTHHGPGWNHGRQHTRRVCRNIYRNHHRVRTCRTVRYDRRY